MIRRKLKEVTLSLSLPEKPSQETLEKLQALFPETKISMLEVWERKTKL